MSTARDLLNKMKTGKNAPAPSAPATPAAATVTARQLLASMNVASGGTLKPAPKPTPAAAPLRSTQYSFGATDKLLGIKPETADFQEELQQANYQSEQLKSAKEQLGTKRGLLKQYSHDVNEVLASANRGIGDTVNMFGKALSFLGKSNDDAGLWKYYTKAGEFMTKGGEGMAEKLATKDSEAIRTILADDPIEALRYKEFWLTNVPQT